jgi:hypothetical protein
LARQRDQQGVFSLVSHHLPNSAAVFPIWDVIFGTAWRPAPDEYPTTGLADGDGPRSLWDGVVWPFRRRPGLASKSRGLISEQIQKQRSSL